MGKSKVAITIDKDLLTGIDELVSRNQFPNRSQAIEEAVQEKLDRLRRTRLSRECAKLEPDFEQQLADEGLTGDLKEWPEY